MEDVKDQATSNEPKSTTEYPPTTLILHPGDQLYRGVENTENETSEVWPLNPSGIVGLLGVGTYVASKPEVANEYAVTPQKIEHEFHEIRKRRSESSTKLQRDFIAYPDDYADWTEEEKKLLTRVPSDDVVREYAEQKFSGSRVYPLTVTRDLPLFELYEEFDETKIDNVAKRYFDTPGSENNLLGDLRREYRNSIDSGWNENNQGSQIFRGLDALNLIVRNFSHNEVEGILPNQQKKYWDIAVPFLEKIGYGGIVSSDRNFFSIFNGNDLETLFPSTD